MNDLPRDLRVKAGMIMMCERIPFGSDAALMEMAANEIEHLQQRNAELAAQVEQLQNLMKVWYDQSERDREVAAMAVDLFANETCGNCVSDEEIWLSRKATAYANKIKSGEVKI